MYYDDEIPTKVTYAAYDMEFLNPNPNGRGDCQCIVCFNARHIRDLLHDLRVGHVGHVGPIYYTGL